MEDVVRLKDPTTYESVKMKYDGILQLKVDNITISVVNFTVKDDPQSTLFILIGDKLPFDQMIKKRISNTYGKKINGLKNRLAIKNINSNK